MIFLFSLSQRFALKSGTLPFFGVFALMVAVSSVSRKTCSRGGVPACKIVERVTVAVSLMLTLKQAFFFPASQSTFKIGDDNLSAAC